MLRMMVGFLGAIAASILVALPLVPLNSDVLAQPQSDDPVEVARVRSLLDLWGDAPSTLPQTASAARVTVDLTEGFATVEYLKVPPRSKTEVAEMVARYEMSGTIGLTSSTQVLTCLLVTSLETFGYQAAHFGTTFYCSAPAAISVLDRFGFSTPLFPEFIVTKNHGPHVQTTAYWDHRIIHVETLSAGLRYCALGTGSVFGQF